MRSINLNRIIEEHKLDPKELGPELFPNNAYPMHALKRVLQGKSLLDSEQISRLAIITNMSIEQVFSDSFKIESGEHTFTLTKGVFKAVLNTKTWVTKIYKKDTMFHEEVIHPKMTPLSEYFEKLNFIIHKNQ